MDNKKLVGLRIKDLRKRASLSQEALAELAGIEPTSLSNIENGRNFPSFITLESIMKALNVGYFDVFQFAQYAPVDDLISEINAVLRNNPDKVREAYRIIKALVD